MPDWQTVIGTNTNTINLNGRTLTYTGTDGYDWATTVNNAWTTTEYFTEKEDDALIKLEERVCKLEKDIEKLMVVFDKLTAKEMKELIECEE